MVYVGIHRNKRLNNVRSNKRTQQTKVMRSVSTQIHTDLNSVKSVKSSDRKRPFHRRRILFWSFFWSFCVFILVLISTIIILSLYFTKTGLFAGTTTLSQSSISISNNNSTTTTISTSTTTSVTTDTTTTTTDTPVPCSAFLWNQTGEVIAGTGNPGTASNELNGPIGIYIDTNGVLFISDSNNNRVQMWLPGATNGITVAGDPGGTAGSNSSMLHRPRGLTMDKNGFLYVVDEQNFRVQRFSLNSPIGSTVAGQTGNSSLSLSTLGYPWSIDVDQDLNLYIGDIANSRIMMWRANATQGTIFTSGSTISFGKLFGIQTVPGSPDQIYFSDHGNDKVYLWSYGFPNPDVMFHQVQNLPDISQPFGIRLDSCANLYVIEIGGQSVVRYVDNSTMGEIVLGGNGFQSLLGASMDIAFDQHFNIYISDEQSHVVQKFARL